MKKRKFAEGGLLHNTSGSYNTATGSMNERDKEYAVAEEMPAVEPRRAKPDTDELGDFITKLQADKAAKNAAVEIAPATRAAPVVRATPKPDVVSDQISRNAPTPRAAAPDMVSDQTSRNVPSPKPGMVPDQISRNVPTRKLGGNQNDYRDNQESGSGKGPTPDERKKTFSRYPLEKIKEAGNAAFAPRTAEQLNEGKSTPRPVPFQNSDAPTKPIRKISPSASETSSPEAGITSRKSKFLLQRTRPLETMPMKKGGVVKASKRGDGIAQRGKTKGRLL